MSKICRYCNCSNPDDFLVCKECGKLLNDNNAEGIKIGRKTTVVVLILVLCVLFIIGVKVYDRNAYRVVPFPDKHTKLEVLSFKIPSKWVPIGKVTYNPNSIPNLYTFFIAAINPQNNVKMQYFSSQFETDDGAEFYLTKNFNVVKSEDYFRNVIKKLSPKAQNIKFIKRMQPDEKELAKAFQDKYIFENIYEELNPGTTKGFSWLETYRNVPVKYLFSYEENGKTIYQLLEGHFIFFVQCFSRDKELIDGKMPRIYVAIKFIKCADIFSYEAEKNLYNKYINQYNVFKNNIKMNHAWEEKTDLARRELLSKTSYTTTSTLVGGDKFIVENFKNSIYQIEFLEDYAKNSYYKDAKADFDYITKKCRNRLFRENKCYMDLRGM